MIESLLFPEVLSLNWAVMLVGFIAVSAYARYLVIGGSSYLVFWKWKKKRFQNRRIQNRKFISKIMRQEALYSISTSFIFGLTGLAAFSANHFGWVEIYYGADKYGWGYWFLSLGAMILIHDTYFYWMHRFLHLPGIFERFHEVHHRSTNPSPFAAFSFHPIEAVLEAMVVPIGLLIMPLDFGVIVTFIVLSTIDNVYGHLGIELYPKNGNRKPLLKWFNTSTNHNLHHQHFRSNYGLYFRFWDVLMGTTHPEYDKEYDRVTSQEAA